MDCCPICGKEATLLPCFDVREPTQRNCAVIHTDGSTDCPASAFTPPLSIKPLTLTA